MYPSAGRLDHLLQNVQEPGTTEMPEAALQHIYACACRAETPCEAEDLLLGSVVQCPACKVVAACVRPRGGGKAWITVSPDEVEFYGLLAEPGPETAAPAMTTDAPGHANGSDATLVPEMPAQRKRCSIP